MKLHRCVFLAAALTTLGAPVPALGGVDLSGCIVNGEPIPTEIDESAETVVEAKIMNGEFVIVANPFVSYFGWETLRWLYLRQCAHIEFKHDIEALRAGKMSLREESEADCWAIRWLIEREDFDDRQVRTIVRDLERLDAEKWLKLLGPKRAIDFSYCLKK